MQLPCNACGRTVTFPPSRLPKSGRIFCGRACYHSVVTDEQRAHLRAQSPIANAKNWAGHDMTPNTSCGVCGTPLYRRPCEMNNRSRHFCSDAHRVQGLRGVTRGETRQCSTCGRAFKRRFRNDRESLFCSSACWGMSIRKPTVEKNGYALVLTPNHPRADAYGYVRQHRLVMEASIGRLLTSREVVHHRNGIKTDNRLENLELVADNSTHMRSHHKVKVKAIRGADSQPS